MVSRERGYPEGGRVPGAGGDIRGYLQRQATSNNSKLYINQAEASISSDVLA